MFRSAILNPKPNADIVKQAGNFIDVRDLVHVHAEAFVQEVAGGERWLVAKGETCCRLLSEVWSADTHLRILEPVSWQKVCKYSLCPVIDQRCRTDTHIFIQR